MARLVMGDAAASLLPLAPREQVLATVLAAAAAAGADDRGRAHARLDGFTASFNRKNALNSFLNIFFQPEQRADRLAEADEVGLHIARPAHPA